MKVGSKDGKKRRSLMKVNSVYGLLLAVQSGVGLAALPDYIAHNINGITKGNHKWLKVYINLYLE